jgi:hypothetical protein
MPIVRRHGRKEVSAKALASLSGRRLAESPTEAISSAHIFQMRPPVSVILRMVKPRKFNMLFYSAAAAMMGFIHVNRS